ncbi:hypothetical protein Glove_537g15 [Diversispora epigaea]|uniref:F-box/LRR-repeat protein 15-like leucin rich repeat domain-containing protein n=1 Tax=Diversispora epigaea TaxID=1348612 RepID=A0A397GGU1_9GLOM|nr:hypothetical protein Glove_537g15 [Diversispora epigaea]
MLYKIARSYSNLCHLKIKWCCGLSDRVISKIAQIYFLEFLSVSYNSKGIKQSSNITNIKDTTLCKITNSCSNLQHLNLGSSKITDISLRTVAHSCINLCCLKLEYSKHITDIFIIKIVQNCPHLEYLSLQTSNITNVSLKQIVESCPKLLILSLVRCQKITDEGICAISSACPNM